MEIAQSLGTVPEKVVVKKISFASRFLDYLIDAGYWIFRILSIFIVLGLVSFALTILINEQLRTTVFDIMKTYF